MLKILILIAILTASTAQTIKKNDDIPVGAFYGQPSQIHISYGSNPTQMIITWTTLDLVYESVVEYGDMTSINKTQTGDYKLFKDDGLEQRQMIM
jgi:hypothetical protein